MIKTKHEKMVRSGHRKKNEVSLMDMSCSQLSFAHIPCFIIIRDVCLKYLESDREISN
jgi:hypothetical protein